MKFNPFSYRHDIDGLRAIAVLLVIFFHAEFSFLGGGYIGVDVFFVLSGFLITLTIDKEMSEDQFSFKQFYLRRIRRIIPVLVFVILVSVVPAYFILFADNFESYSRTLLHTMLSTNNFHLWITQKDYFSENSDLIPFLHTWSLSVEEQFYFLWPISLLFLHKKMNLQKRLIFVFIFLIFGIIVSVYLTDMDPNMAYFLLPARIFELGIGACLAMFWDKLPEVSKAKNHIISIVGFGLILVPACVLNKTSIFPGINAFWPCLGTAMLILSGKNTNSKGIINTILQNKLLVLVGLLSYSMYLWHWPLFMFIKYLGINLEGMIRIISLVVIFVLSYFSWRFIEQPFRVNLKFDFKRTMLYGFLPSLLLIAGIYGVIDAEDGFPERFPELSEFNPKANYPNKVRKECFDKFKVGNCDECHLGIKKDTLDGVLIGDSFANHTAAFLDVLAKDAGLYIHDSAAGGYPLMYNVNTDGSARYPEKYAIDRLNYAKKFKSIFIAANWEGITKKKDYDLTIITLGKLIKNGKKIIIFDGLRSTTNLNLHKAKLLKAKVTINFPERDLSILEYKRPDDYIVYEIKRKFPSVIIIDLNDVMCKSGKCEIQLKNTIVYRNGNHLNTIGAKLLADEYLKSNKNPLKQLNLKQHNL